MEYGSTPYIGMAPKKMAAPLYVYKVICSKLCPRLSDKLFVDHTCHSRVFSTVTRLLVLTESIADVPNRRVAKLANHSTACFCISVLTIITYLYQCSYYYNVTTATHFGSVIKRTPRIIST